MKCQDIGIYQSPRSVKFWLGFKGRLDIDSNLCDLKSIDMKSVYHLS